MVCLRLVYGVCFKNGFLWRQIALGGVCVPGCVVGGGSIPGHVWARVRWLAFRFTALGWHGLWFVAIANHGNDLTLLSGFAFVAGCRGLADSASRTLVECLSH